MRQNMVPPCGDSILNRDGKWPNSPRSIHTVVLVGYLGTVDRYLVRIYLGIVSNVLLLQDSSLMYLDSQHPDSTVRILHMAWVLRRVQRPWWSVQLVPASDGSVNGEPAPGPTRQGSARANVACCALAGIRGLASNRSLRAASHVIGM